MPQEPAAETPPPLATDSESDEAAAPQSPGSPGGVEVQLNVLAAAAGVGDAAALKAALKHHPDMLHEREPSTRMQVTACAPLLAGQIRLCPPDD